MEIREAAEIFAQSYVFQRGLSRPAEIHRAGPLIVMRDAAPKKDARRQEILSFDLDPVATIDAVRAYDPPHHALDVFTLDDVDLPALKSGFKALGYRYQGHEPFMVFDLSKALGPIRHEVHLAEAKRALELAKADRAPSVPAVEIEEKRVRVFYAERDGKPVGGVRNFRICEGASYVANMFVQPEFRRLGLATSLMNALLADAAELGDRWSVLLASQMGAPLYTSLGYDRIGALHLLNPVRAKP